MVMVTDVFYVWLFHWIFWGLFMGKDHDVSDFCDCSMCGEAMESAEWSVSFDDEKVFADKPPLDRICPRCLIDSLRELANWRAGVVITEGEGFFFRPPTKGVCGD